MRHPLLAPDLRELIVDGDANALRDFFEGHHPADAAELLDDLAPGEALFVLKLLPDRQRAEMFSYLDPPLQDGVSEGMDIADLASLITHMSHDERADLMSRLPAERSDQILPRLARAEREDIRRLASYEEGTTGSVMTSDYATLPSDATAAAAIERLRHAAPDRETIYYCYVVNDDRKLIGFISLKDLILSPPNRRVADLMQAEPLMVRVDEDQEAAARTLQEYDLLALPVVDADGRLVGIVTHDDVIDVIVEEATEDVHRLGGVEPLDDSYLRTSFFSLFTKRGFWLAILFFGGFLTTTAMVFFNDLVESLPALMLFLPLIVSAGGNCGSQSATLITRALALDELNPGDWFRVLYHEILMGLSLGVALGAVGFLRAILVPDDVTSGLPSSQLALVVALGVACVVIVGNLVGALLPLLLKRLGLDPALMSNPVVASLVDVTGIVAYFAIAQALLL